MGPPRLAPGSSLGGRYEPIRNYTISQAISRFDFIRKAFIMMIGQLAF